MPMPKLSDINFKAVIVGAVIDNMTTLFLMTFLAAALVSSGLSESEVMDRMKGLNGLLLGLIIGLCCTVLGGYVTGRMAKKDEVLHGALVAVIGMTMAFIFRESGIPLWFDIAGFAAMLPAGMYGGHLAKKPRAPG